MTGAKIYYTGDIANPSGWFRVTRDTISTLDLAEIDGDRTILGITRAQVGTIYQGHCNPRFVTEEAYNTYRAERMAEYARYARA